MAIFLGIDTGGTYTDAVLLQNETTVLAKAKALTTRHDLAVGIAAALDRVLAISGVSAGDIALASLSTTLATNALVQGQGGRVALVAVGFSAPDLKRQGLAATLAGDPLITLTGGHGHDGQEAAPLDIKSLKTNLDIVCDSVTGFAVCSHFATRNPTHEIVVRDVIQAQCGKPVSCSHDLSAQLNGPKRAMTAVLNARLIGMIDHLISAAENLLVARGVAAPLMVVRGDGALISAAMARLRPIETILSGPAASIVGAQWLTGAQNALVSDIGGTTTDIALLRNGRPGLDPMGAKVGPYRTMVEAVAIRTSGLGGDSEVMIDERDLSGGVTLGPQRVVPIALCATQWPDLVHRALDLQISGGPAGEFNGRFVIPIPVRDQAADGLGAREQRFLEKVGDGACPMQDVVANRADIAALPKLIARGLVLISGLTPSDASHHLARQAMWDTAAADKALRLFCRKKTGAGDRVATDETHLAKMIIAQLETQTSEALLTAAFSQDGAEWDGTDPEKLARHALTRAGLNGHRGLLALDLRLNLPIVGLGASAGNYYPAVGARLRTETILPDHGDVANAIGAVVGQVSMAASGAITCPSDGTFRVYLPEGPVDFDSEKIAIERLEQVLRQQARARATAAGAVDISVSIERQIRRSNVEGRDTFIGAELIVTAVGRPRIAAN